MTDDQLSHLWSFSRGALAGAEFEQWFFAQDDLEGPLGEELHWNLISGNYADRDEVWKLRKSLAAALAPLKQCECPTIRDVAAIPVGGDFYFEKVFETLEQLVEYGPEKWWLYISKCRSCATIWLVAQDSRIYDDFFLARTDGTSLAEAQAGKWPERFSSYEDVLRTGLELSHPPRFSDPMAGSLQWTVEDLLTGRPSISTGEIANLLGLSDSHASALVHKVQSPRSGDNL